MPDPQAPGLRLPRRLPSSERARWTLYEQEKRRLQELALSPKEYERAIDDLTDRLNL